MKTQTTSFGWRHFLPSTLLLTLATMVSTASAATLVVTNLADSGPGTLRARLAAAAPGDTINFAVFGTISLNSPLVIATNVTVNPGGATFMKVSANANSRVFDITGGTVSIIGATIADGRVVGTNGATGFNGETVHGGGIRVASGAQLHLHSCVISNCAAIGGQAGSGASAGNGFGGAVGSLGYVSLTRCLVVSNSVTGGSGGAFDIGGQGWGGGLYLAYDADIRFSTIYGNVAAGGAGGGGLGTGAGGGIYNVGELVMLISTVASNAAASAGLDFGGGIDDFGALYITDSTIVGNRADYGGGITGGDIKNTILAGNIAGNGPDGYGTIVSSDFNCIQNTSGITFTGTTTHNLTGQDPLLGPLQFNDGPELDYVMVTMLPRPGSPVIDKGLSSNSTDQRGKSRFYNTSLPNAVGGNGSDIGAVEVNPATLDVLNTNNSGPGSLRQAMLDNNGLGGGNTLIISNNVAGTITLSVELTATASVIIRGPGPDVLAVSGNNNSRVFTILDGPVEISGLTIRDGRVVGSPGSQGNNGFDGRGGGIYSQATLTLSNCVVLSNTVIGGMGGERHLGQVGRGGQGFGGGLFNAGSSFQLINSYFIGNRAIGGQGGLAQNGEAGEGGNGLGGAIGGGGGTNSIVVCELVDNLAQGGAGGVSGGGEHGRGGQGLGGAIHSESELNIRSSTIRGGSAVGGAGGGGDGSGSGGGIYSMSSLGLRSCTIAGNSASGSPFDFGGGVYTIGISAGLTNCTVAGNQADYGGGWHGDATVANSIFAGNTSGSGADFNGTMNSFDYNLVQSFGGLNIIGATANVIIGQNPLLGPLQDNGGPTRTMALLAGSPAIDKGMNFGVSYDQRGVGRPYNLPSIPNANGGDGSDIGAFEFLPTPLLQITRVNGNAILSWTTDAADFQLEYTTSLPASNWLEATDPRTFAGNQVYVTNSVTGPMKFYRLSHP